jgi:hypothetical protein
LTYLSIEVLLVPEQPAVFADLFYLETPVLEDFNDDLHDKYRHRKVQQEGH